MLEKSAYKKFIALSKKKIHVEISDVDEYYESKPGVWHDVDIEMGRIKFDSWSTIDSFEKYLKKEKSAILEEVEDNSSIINSPVKYLMKLINEIKLCHNNFTKKEINNSSYNLYNNIVVYYRPNLVNLTKEEKLESKSSNEYPVRSIDLENKKNTPILQSIASYSDLHLNTLIDIYRFIEKKIELEYSESHNFKIDPIEPKGIFSGNNTKLSIEASKPAILWEKSDTDLLELITALIESKSIDNQTKDITRKEAIEFFAKLFGLEIKDAESKLSRATSRKKDVAQYLTLLKNTFEDYAKDKEDRLDGLRK